MQGGLTSELSFCLPSFPLAGTWDLDRMFRNGLEWQEELLSVGRRCFGSFDSAFRSNPINTESMTILLGEHPRNLGLLNQRSFLIVSIRGQEEQNNIEI